MSREFRCAVRTAVLLSRRRPRTSFMKAGVRQTGAATRIIHTRGRHGVGKRLVHVFRDLCMVMLGSQPITVLRCTFVDGTGTCHRRVVHQCRGRCRMTPGPKSIAQGARARVGIDLHIIRRDLKGSSHCVHRFTESVGGIRRALCNPRTRLRIDPDGCS